MANSEKEPKKIDRKLIWIGGVIGVVAAAAIIFGISYFKPVKSPNTGDVAGVQTQNTQPKTTEAPNYFSETAKVMYFYSEGCHYCQQEATVLQELGKEGYRVKPMDVAKDENLWQKYNIKGTPTFIAANGDTLVGYREKAELQKWLDAHK